MGLGTTSSSGGRRSGSGSGRRIREGEIGNRSQDRGGSVVEIRGEDVGAKDIWADVNVMMEKNVGGGLRVVDEGAEENGIRARSGRSVSARGRSRR